MITTATLLAALMCWGLGWIGLALIERVTSSGSSGVPEASGTEQHALAVLLGITLWVFVLTALGHVTALAVLPAWLAWGLGAACAIVGTRCALRARGRQPKIDLPDRCRPLDRVAVGVALGFLGLSDRPKHASQLCPCRRNVEVLLPDGLDHHVEGPAE